MPQKPKPDSGGQDPRDIATNIIREVGRSHAKGNDGENDDDFSHVMLADQLQHLTVDQVENRFFGKSSGAMLVQAAIELKNEYTGLDKDLKGSILSNVRPEFWVTRPVSSTPLPL